ncbi:MAG: divalent cation tolerance protein CutA [Patescibacteria group bacterium]|nr:divalent cation tolerance protein CutA [Patescibacteria group bacterium]
MKTIFVYLTVSDIKIGEKISKILIEKKLIACVNLFPIKSFYFWEEKIIKDKEIVLLLKTFEEKYKEIEKEIRKIHPYKIPLLAKINTEINIDYFQWMKKQIK